MGCGVDGEGGCFGCCLGVGFIWCFLFFILWGDLLVVVGRVGLVFVLVLVVVVFVWLVVVGGACGWVCDPLGRWLECWRRLVREGWWLLWLLD